MVIVQAGLIVMKPIGIMVMLIITCWRSYMYMYMYALDNQIGIQLKDQIECIPKWGGGGGGGLEGEVLINRNVSTTINNVMCLQKR